MKLTCKDSKFYPDVKDFDLYVEQYRFTGEAENLAGEIYFVSAFLHLPVENSIQATLRLKEEEFKSLLNTYCQLGKIESQDYNTLFKEYL